MIVFEAPMEIELGIQPEQFRLGVCCVELEEGVKILGVQR